MRRAFVLKPCSLGVPHASRASRKLFQLATISPSSTGYAHASQKILKAAAARLMVFWVADLVFQCAQVEPTNHNVCFTRKKGKQVLFDQRDRRLIAVSTCFELCMYLAYCTQVQSKCVFGPYKHICHPSRTWEMPEPSSHPEPA